MSVTPCILCLVPETAYATSFRDFVLRDEFLGNRHRNLANAERMRRRAASNERFLATGVQRRNANSI
jgi:hypothetical protein